MLKYSLILCIVSSIGAYLHSPVPRTYVHARSPYLPPTYINSPYIQSPMPNSPYIHSPMPNSPYIQSPMPNSPYIHSPMPYSPFLYRYPNMYQPSYQHLRLPYHPFHQNLVHQPSPANLIPQAEDETYEKYDVQYDEQLNQPESRFFFGSYLAGEITRGDLNGSVSITQNIFLGNNGHNARFKLSLDGGTEADTTYVVLILEDGDQVNTFCPITEGTRQALPVDGNSILAGFSTVFEGLGKYKTNRAGIWLLGSMLKHNIDGEGTYDGTYPSAGFLSFANEFAAASVALALAPAPIDYTPATSMTVTGNKMSAKGKWFVVLKNWSSAVAINSYGCAKLE